MAFVADVTVPDGTTISATEKFTKTWRFQNAGTCTWTTSYKFVFIGGDQMGAPDSITLPRIVTPGETVDISLGLTAPENPGTYRGNWQFEDQNGTRFGLGNNGTGEIWVQVDVIAAPTSTFTLVPEPTQTATLTPEPAFLRGEVMLAYDFVAEACSAAWTKDGAAQPCPGSNNSAADTSIAVPTLEDGSTPGYPALRFHPGAANSTISAMYPEYEVQPGDHFRAYASCEPDAALCSALFRLSYIDETGAVGDLWAVGEFQDGNYTGIDVDLNALVGRKVRLILNVTALNDDPANNVYWVSPGLYRLPVPTATPTETASPTAAPSATVTATTAPATPTVTPTPQPKQPATIWESIQQWIDDLFESLFGG